MSDLPPVPRLVSAARPAVTAPAPDTVFSDRVKRRLAYLLRLHLLELREEGLERARAVIEHRLSVEQLLESTHPFHITAEKPPRKSK